MSSYAKQQLLLDDMLGTKLNRQEGLRYDSQTQRHSLCILSDMELNLLAFQQIVRKRVCLLELGADGATLTGFLL